METASRTSSPQNDHLLSFRETQIQHFYSNFTCNKTRFCPSFILLSFLSSSLCPSLFTSVERERQAGREREREMVYSFLKFIPEGKTVSKEKNRKYNSREREREESALRLHCLSLSLSQKKTKPETDRERERERDRKRLWIKKNNLLHLQISVTFWTSALETVHSSNRGRNTTDRRHEANTAAVQRFDYKQHVRYNKKIHVITQSRFCLQPAQHDSDALKPTQEITKYKVKHPKSLDIRRWCRESFHTHMLDLLRVCGASRLQELNMQHFTFSVSLFCFLLMFSFILLYVSLVASCILM